MLDMELPGRRQRGRPKRSLVQFSVETPDCLREEAVQQSGCLGPNATVLLSRRQEGEECVRGVCGVIHNAVGFADAACGVNVHNRGNRDYDDLLSCPHYPLQGLAIQHGAIPEPDSDAAAQDALSGPSVEAAGLSW
ncbi:hypothetical protein QTP70_007819 [Hemibagrus guttatus]|uniref:Uncharacterized protein n=1 Tax=Hemibagrus guttatus TaxID=175788 RepID=A0AAE0PSE5_9TELE|nr:hypothetical protein QTP70_007819 [Hemibagrus guttatus]